MVSTLRPFSKGKALDEALHASGFGNFESLLGSIGLGKVSTSHFIDKLLPKEKIEEKRLKESDQIKLKEKAPDHSGAIHLKCFNDDILLRVGNAVTLFRATLSWVTLPVDGA